MTDAQGPGAPDRGEDDRSPYVQLARLFGAQLFAVLGVAAVITIVVALVGGGTAPVTTTQGEQSAQSAPPSSTASADDSPPSPDSVPPSSPAPQPTSATPPPAEPTTDEPTEALPRTRVDVLNQSASGGSAARTAARLERRGWRIGRVDDFSGNVSTTTVYYPAGRRSDAERLAEDLPGSPRLRERFSTLKDNRLSVVLVG